MHARAVAFLLATAWLLPARAQEAPDDYDRLGKLERQETDAALRELGLTVERRPAGKTIGRVLIAPREVFSRRDGRLLTWFNVFHTTTRDRAIRRELLFGPGDPWDQGRVDETLRGIRDPLLHNVVVVVPVAAADPAQVDVLVVVRDVWSLRLNTRYEVQGLDLINLSFSLSENNLFGLRKRFAAAFLMDQGTIAVGPSYVDPNIAGTRLTLTTLWRLVFARDGGDFEGTRSQSVLAYPLYSLRSRWGAQLTVTHTVGKERRFIGTALRTYDVPETMEVETAPWIYRRTDVVTQAEVQRAWGAAFRQTLRAGHELDLQRPGFVDEFPADPALRAAFTRDVLPRSELSSALYLGYEVYTPVYGAYRDLETFDFREDFQLGPLLQTRATVAREELGSEVSYLRLSAAGRWSWAWRGGLFRLGASAGARLQDGDLIDKNPSLSLLAVTPSLDGWLRVVVSAAIDALIDDENNGFVSIGGSTGLRGFRVNEFSGTTRVAGHFELRSRPLRIEFFRLGAVAFWDAGHAADSWKALSLQHSVGAGIRGLIPQLDPLVFRVDWAFPLTGDDRGFPGRISLGVEQAF